MPDLQRGQCSSSSSSNKGSQPSRCACATPVHDSPMMGQPEVLQIPALLTWRKPSPAAHTPVVVDQDLQAHHLHCIDP
jgi:hypothetical protein